MIYLDYAATTPLDERAEEAMRPFARTVFGNPSSLHQSGQQARAALDAARDHVAEILGAQAEEIIFTGSGTEADNLAVLGAARALRGRGAHIITTAIEHHAVLSSCRLLEREGFRVSYLQPDTEGRIHPQQVAQAVTAETCLVSVMAANNEVGTIQPITEIGQLCRARHIVVHTDAVQAAGELPLRVADLSVDLLSIASHKVYGPKGVGALYVRRGTRLQPLIVGGGQEYERRAGTENVAGIVGFATALAQAHQHEETARMRTLRDRLIAGCLAIPDSRLHGSLAQRLANNVNVGFAGVSGETLLVALDLAGIAASTGAACAAGALEPSHVLQAMGYALTRAQEAVRFSLGRETTSEEIDTTIAVLGDLVTRLRRHRLTPPTPPGGCSTDA
ncbi:MAG TPA: cysteine desulfurase family protein [Armatimonadota bacterium]|jgi:cysteine desulfurase